MSNQINAESAIQKAYRTIYRPPIFIIIGLSILVFMMAMVFKIKSWGLILTLPLGLLLGIMYRSIMLPKWKVWAFESVNNVHALQRAATLSKIIAPDSSWLTKLEIWSAADRDRWTALQQRFAVAETQQDDLTIPEKTVIYFSRKTNLYYFFLMLCVLSMGIFYIFAYKQMIIGSFLSLLGLVLTYIYGRQLLNRKAQVILSNDGIETVEQGLTPWSEIKNEAVVSQGSGRQTRYFLSFEHGETHEHIEVGFLDISTTALSELLRLYKYRFLSK